VIHFKKLKGYSHFNLQGIKIDGFASRFSTTLLASHKFSFETQSSPPQDLSALQGNLNPGAVRYHLRRIVRRWRAVLIR
jgi:hypothetical protein